MYGRRLMSASTMVCAKWSHDATANVILDFFNIVFGPRIMSNRYLDHHNCGKFGQISALIWIFRTSFYGVYWKRCSHENLQMKLRWKLGLMSCAEGLRKTCFTVLLWTCHQHQEITEEMVATSSINWHRRNLHKYVGNLFQSCSGENTFFITNFHESSILGPLCKCKPSSLYKPSVHYFKDRILSISWMLHFYKLCWSWLTDRQIM